MSVYLIVVTVGHRHVVERVVIVHLVESEGALVVIVGILAVGIHSHGERQGEREPLGISVIKGDETCIAHLVGGVETDVERSEEGLLVGQHDVVFCHIVVARDGERSHVVGLVRHALRQVDHGVGGEHIAYVVYRAKRSVVGTVEHRVDAAGVEIENVLCVGWSPRLAVGDVGIDLVYYLLGIGITLTLVEKRIGSGVAQGDTHAHPLLAVETAAERSVVVDGGIGELRLVVLSLERDVRVVVGVVGMARCGGRRNVVACLVGGDEVAVAAVARCQLHGSPRAALRCVGGVGVAIFLVDEGR